MTLYHYTAERDGKQYSGSMEAKNRFEVYRSVRKDGGKIISVSTDSARKWTLQYWNERLSTIKEHDKIIFANNLSAMVAAGLSITRALAVSKRQTKNPKLKMVLTKLDETITSGGTLHEAMAQFPHVFSTIFVAMVRAGEESGGLSEALKTIAEQLSRSYTLKKKIKGAMTYPIIVVVAMIGIGILMMIKVVPSLSATFKEAKLELPTSTKMIIALSDALQHHIVLTGLAFLGMILFILFIPKTKYGKYGLDWLTLHLPLIKGMSREINSARMSRTLASLLSSGVHVVDALEITSQVLNNHYHSRVLVEATKTVQTGAQLSDVFRKNEHLFTPLVTEMMAVGEETGALSELLEDIASFYEEEVSQKTENMSTIIEPFLMLFIGAGVGFFAVAMIGPVYSLSEAI